MKYKLMGLTGAALILFAAAAANALEPAVETSTRVHQHLTARRDTGCDCDGEELCSHLPLVIIDTGGQEIPGQLTDEVDSFAQRVYSMSEDGGSTIQAEVKVIDNEGWNNHPSDLPAVETGSEFRIRGYSSRYYKKLSYLLKFLDEDGSHQDIPIMGMDAHFEWALHGPILDKTLIRNYMWYNISGEIMRYAPNCRFCEVVLDGEYQGVYLMVETITDGENCRLNLSVNVKHSQATGFLLRMDRPNDAELESIRDIYSYAERINRVFQDFAIRFPGKSMLTEEIKQEIELAYAAFEKSLYSYDYNTGPYAYWNYIDVDDFVDYYLINEFAQNDDMGAYSTYIYKEPGEPYRLCVWDFDNSLGNFPFTVDTPDRYLLNERAWYVMLFKNEAFVQRVLKRYAELRESWLNEAYLLDYIDQVVEYLGPAAERNNRRWADQIANWDGLGVDKENPHSFEEAVEMMKTRIVQRGGWMDETIHSLQQHCHPSRNKKYNH